MLENNFDSFKAKEAQLAISLKFHHSQILSEMSLESALTAMTQVWQSCHMPQSVSNSSQIESQEETIICDRQIIDGGFHP